MTLTNDPIIRKVIRQRLATTHDGQDAVIVDELRVGRGSARIDVAVVNGLIDGFEIKSDKDTLERLERQAMLYGEIADRMTLVVGERHLDEAVQLIPDWWSVILARPHGESCRLRSLRKGHRNRSLSAWALVNMLERQELMTLLSIHSLQKGASRKIFSELADTATSGIKAKDIASFVKHVLKVRATFEVLHGRSAFARAAIICGPSSQGAGLL
ncbi:sce7726 family protein [Rhizobium sp. P28RR-XV]|uniref:sce7726 family protein n=1 Tax=Rhizobium sp. P28RR-XV TaxID=2726737 RepID=UPI0014568448|nr:sce7726 family protein [Rhizobium sp. P28RR-XV]NLR83759.1 sce7726 family protein [Rhizobium sp. P28RR-XV]